jgi:hypothetical protein
VTARLRPTRRRVAWLIPALLAALVSCHAGTPPVEPAPQPKAPTAAIEAAAPSPAALPATIPASIRFEVRGRTDREGFCAAEGTTNLPPGARVLVVIAAAPDRGSDLSESDLVPIAADGAFAFRSHLAYPVAYRLRAEFALAENPERPEWFGPSWPPGGIEKPAAIERGPDGARLVAQAAWRIGTEAQETELLGTHVEALETVLKRLKYDREQAEKKIKPPAAGAAAAYLKWARIRAEKEHSLKIDQPAVDPFFGALDLSLRRLWTTLDEVGLYFLARALGDDKEVEYAASALKRFDRLIPEAEADLARLQGPTK